MKNLIILFIISLLFLSACREKNKNLVNNSYTLSGVILKNCEGEPLANAEVALMLESNEFLGVEWGGSTTRFKTDANGRFAVSYQAVSNSNISLVLFNNVGFNRILSAIPQNQNVDLGTIYLNRKGNLVLKFNPMNVLSDQDTLIITNLKVGQPFKKIAGPFIEPILDTTSNLVGNFYHQDSKMLITFSYKVNSSSSWKTNEFYIKASCEYTIYNIDF